MKNAIIIGATSGIGYELANLLSKNGYKVGITGRRTEKLMELQSTNPDMFIPASFDCTSSDNTKELRDLTDRLGGLDLIIISSGRSDLNEELDYNKENDTNLLNVIAFTEIIDWAYNYFKQKGNGHIVAITSIAGIRGGQIAPAYFASKAYQINYLEGLRQKAQSQKKKMRITDIRPGFVDTAMAKGEGLFWVVPKEKAGKQIFRTIKCKKDVGYVSKRWRIIAFILKFLPRWIHKRL